MSSEVPGKAKIPKPPSHLGREGKKLWGDMHKELPETWEFDGRELRSLALACQLQDRLTEIRMAIETEGVLVSGSTGQTTLNRAITEERHVAEAIVKFLNTLALPNFEGVPETMAQIRGRESAKKREASKRARELREAEKRKRRSSGG